MACGLLALLLAGIGLWPAQGDGHEVSRWLYDAAGLLTFEPPEDAPTNAALSAALVFVVLFATVGMLGVVLELYQPARDGLRRFRFWCARGLYPDYPPAVVIGLGWVGGPLATELRGRGRPVYAIAMDEESPRAVKARRSGVLVVAGDATDGGVRQQVPLGRGTEVFVATGDDARNVQIAGDVLGDLDGSRRPRNGAAPGPGPNGRGREPRERSLACYIHAADPGLSATLRSSEVLRHLTDSVAVRTFNTAELSAHDLFFDTTTGLLRADALPGRSEVFHLFVFGFGTTGQSVALHLARFGHFASGLRPRLTVYGDLAAAAGEQSWQGFLERHPAFSPEGLVLADDAFLRDGDGWEARPGRPTDLAYRRPPVMEKRAGQQTMRVTPLEYAVNAEFLPLPTAIESGGLLSQIEARLRPAQGAQVRAAAVFCFEEERRSFQLALRFQGSLAHHFLDDGTVRSAATRAGPLLPIHVFLPVEPGLRRVLSRPGTNERTEVEAGIEAAFPLHVFGEQEDVSSYAAVTKGRLRARAVGIRTVHEILSGRAGGAHPDFEDSDIDAVLHAETLKLPALGIRFFTEPQMDEAQARARGVWRQPLLRELCGHAAADAQRVFEAAADKHPKTGKLQLSLEQADELKVTQPVLWQRLALLDRVVIPRAPKDRPEAPEERRQRTGLDAARNAAVAEVIRRFARETHERGYDADAAAAMEHNRWMGERLAKGWRYGERDDVRRQRDTFVPWTELTEEEQHYDRAHLPRLILEHSLAPKCHYAYMSLPAHAPRSALLLADGTAAGEPPQLPPAAEGAEPLPAS
jgi:hypothetical protein